MSPVRKSHTATVRRIRSRERLKDGTVYLLHHIETARWLIATWEFSEFRAFGVIHYWNEVDVWELPETKKIS